MGSVAADFSKSQVATEVSHVSHVMLAGLKLRRHAQGGGALVSHVMLAGLKLRRHAQGGEGIGIARDAGRVGLAQAGNARGGWEAQ